MEDSTVEPGLLVSASSTTFRKRSIKQANCLQKQYSKCGREKEKVLRDLVRDHDRLNPSRAEEGRGGPRRAHPKAGGGTGEGPVPLWSGKAAWALPAPTRGCCLIARINRAQVSMTPGPTPGGSWHAWFPSRAHVPPC